MRDFDFDEVIGILKSYVRKMISSVTPQSIEVDKKITAGTELADVKIDEESNSIYMPALKVNGQTQEVSNNEIDLDVASNLITDTQWTSITAILS